MAPGFSKFVVEQELEKERKECSECSKIVNYPYLCTKHRFKLHSNLGKEWTNTVDQGFADAQKHEQEIDNYYHEKGAR